MKKILPLVIAILSYTTSIAQPCPNGTVPATVTINTDTYPAETSWIVQNATTGVTLAQGGNYANGSTTYTQNFCVPPNACLRFTVFDDFGDGMCCGYGNGSYSLSVNGTTLASGGQFTNQFTHFVNCPAGYTCTNPVDITNYGTFNATHNNAWYSFTADSTGTYEISTCNINSCNTRIWIYDNCGTLIWNDNNLGTVFYSDDECGLQAKVTAYFAEGSTYYIRIGSINNVCNNSINWTLNYLGPVVGCMNPGSCNYNPLATVSAPCYSWGDPNCPPGPDLYVLKEPIESSLQVDQIEVDNCYVEEGCVTGYGLRDIIRFTTHIKNIGESDYYIGIPSVNNPQFNYDPCHNHWHYAGYADYLLFDADGNAIPVGIKNGFCVLDLECSDGGNATYGCDNMGISKDCGDIYGSGLACQWIDITDVDTGSYSLVVRVNWDQDPDALGRVESTFTNNIAKVCIKLTRDVNGNPEFTLEPNCPTYTDCFGVEFGTAKPDCNGNCNGIALAGDYDVSGTRDGLDALAYINAIIGDTTYNTPCTDLNADNVVNLYDAAIDNRCVLLNNDPNNNHCDFPYNFTNITDTVTLSIANVNLAPGSSYVDVQIKNPAYRTLGYQFSVSGVTLVGAQSLTNIIDYDIAPQYRADGSAIIGFNFNGNALERSLTNQPLVRLFIDQITDTAICISDIEVIVNEQYEQSLPKIGGTCFAVTGIDQTMANVGMKVYPNPSQGEFNVELTSPLNTSYNLTVTDVTGRVIYTNTLSGKGLLTENIDLRGMNSGMYGLTIKTDKGSKTERLVVVGTK